MRERGAGKKNGVDFLLGRCREEVIIMIDDCLMVDFKINQFHLTYTRLLRSCVITNANCHILFQVGETEAMIERGLVKKWGRFFVGKV